MASWADKIPTFNPYVQQLPVEAMVKVGMAKQQQYEEGVQKIQTSIDNVAGLDVVSEVDKKYLQSKLNSLGNNLKLVAAGDFSNFQLVNSVSGMAKQITKDENVINAVSSTSRIRKEQKILEAAEAAGKSSIQNRAKFEDGVNQYINKKDIKQSYNGRYTQYTNIDKKLREVADKIHESDTSYDNPFQRDASGNTLYFYKDASGKEVATTDSSKGSPKQDAAMLSVGSKAKSAQKILNTFYDTLTPDDIEQLKIDGWYHYKGKDVNTFKQDIVSNYNKTKSIVTNGVTEMALELQTNSKLTPAQRAQYQADIDTANAKLADGSLEKSRDKEILDLESITDFEGYKEKLYTQKTLTNLAADLAYDDKKLELKTNPYEQANDRRLQLNLAYSNAAREQRNWERDFDRDNAHWQYEQEAKANEQYAKSKEETAKKQRDTFGAIDPGAISTTVNVPSLAKLGGEINLLTGKRDASGKIIIQGELDRLNLSAFSTIPGGDKMSNSQKEDYLTKLTDKYLKNPGSISNVTNNPGLRKYLESRRELQIKVGLKQKLYNSAKKLTQGLDEDIQGLIKSQKGIVDKNGRELYSAKELFDVYNALQKFHKLVPQSGGGKPVMSFDKQAAMNNFKGTKYQNIANAYIKQQELIAKGSLNAEPLSYSDRIILDQTNKIKSRVTPVASQINNKKLTIQSNFLAKNDPERQTQVGTFNTGVKGTRDRIAGFIGNELVTQKSLGAFDSNKLEDASVESIKKMLKTSGTLYSMVKKFDGSADMIIEGAEGRQVLHVSASKVNRHFPEIAKVNPLNAAKYAIQSSPDRTTNLFTGSGEGGAVNSMFSGFDLPLLSNSQVASRVRFDIEGSPDNDGSNLDEFTLKMYVQPKGSNTWVKGYMNQNYVSLAGIQETINNIGDTTIDSFLTKNK